MSASSPSSRPNRVFFALWPPPDVACAIAARAARYGLGGRPVAAERLHLTLAFYGKRDPRAIDRLADRADRVGVAAFALRLDRLGHFRRAGLAWLGPAVVPQALADLADGLTVDTGAARRGLSLPHVSVCRAAPPVAARAIDPIDWPVTHFSLTASGAGGAPGAYRDLVRWRLARRAVPPRRI